MLRLRNKIQNYAWGSRTWLAEFLGNACPSPEPEAELWMGAHPSAPSEVWNNERNVPLDEFIAQAPERILGPRVHGAFGAELPFLLKVLCADVPLSLQAHPSVSQAQDGFERENERAIPLNAAQRCYKDRSHKPELVCALTPFDALCGFRDAKQTLSLLRALNVAGLRESVATLERTPDARGLRSVFSALMLMSRAEQQALSLHTAEASSRLLQRGSEYEAELRWIQRIAEIYAGDIGVVSALLLNLVQLKPREAIYLPAGNLHAYLRGMGVEIMANSDNVIRGGLTPKHVDVPELLRILSFEPEGALGFQATPRGSSQHYVTEAREFELARLDVAGASATFPEYSGPEIVLCAEGTVQLTGPRGELSLARGQSVFVPADEGAYQVSGQGSIFRAAVPLHSST